MKVTWLGQSGLYLQLGGLHIVIDPYLSDSVGQLDPRKTRRIPADESFFDIPLDVLAFTHDHLDHYDPETAARYLTQTQEITVLAPGTCWQKVRRHSDVHNYVLFNEGTQWTQGSVRFTAVPAVHSDPFAIGLIIQGEGQTLYITGDTLYSRKIFPALPPKIDALFLPINGRGNNMNAADAARFAADCGARLVFPLHVGMTDDLDAHDFPPENKVVPAVYHEMQIGECS